MKISILQLSFFLGAVISVPSATTRDSKELHQVTRLSLLENTIFSGVSPGNSTVSVVGGIEATPHQFPFQVQIQRRNFENGYNHHCGGVIYDATHILTVAHCVKGNHPRNFKVVAGEHEIFHDGGSEQYRDVLGYIFHPGFDKPRFTYDIAIITLDYPLDLNDKVRPLRLPTNIMTLPETGRTVGWGKNGESDEFLKTLHYVDLNIFPREVCLEKYARYAFTETMLCAGDDEGGKGGCFGDSGGPLVCKDADDSEYLCGLVSWGMDPCAQPQYPSVFTSTNPLLEWLHGLLPAQDELFSA